MAINGLWLLPAVFNCIHETWRGTLKILLHASQFATLTFFISFPYSGLYLPQLENQIRSPLSHISESKCQVAQHLLYNAVFLNSLHPRVVICFYSDLWGLTLQVGMPSPLPPLLSTKGIPNLIKKRHIHLSHYCHLPPTWSNHYLKRNNDDECLDGKSHGIKTNFHVF
jgi:hypothetical protein